MLFFARIRILAVAYPCRYRIRAGFCALSRRRSFAVLVSLYRELGRSSRRHLSGTHRYVACIFLPGYLADLLFRGFGGAPGLFSDDVGDIAFLGAVQMPYVVNRVRIGFVESVDILWCGSTSFVAEVSMVPRGATPRICRGRYLRGSFRRCTLHPISPRRLNSSSLRRPHPAMFA